ncbi:SDR family oxidoreductase [Paenibacillus nasutitermitis]|uniref:2-deoxy-D-gluconate 3-dehydrogenase n=1 Tax=Paenibacillus nasutitermitis TaxID=1652958 RepID=A0A917DRE3_9BACL|nr:SDR family oxidoreductase [Paenibacillus nasutitermitis]GGD59446.1 2-deoxy-D-gluconate 3-dehydrogenase [Paenibacillus nasutitermitis]
MANLNLFDLTGRKVIVTGAGRGLGRGIAAALATAGAEVVILDIADAAVNTATELAASGLTVHVVKGNLMDRADLERGFRESVDVLGGRVDILVNNAGMHDRRACLDLPVESWDKVLELNITAVYQLCRLAGAIMVGQGNGKIINMASMLSFLGGFNASAYAVSKAGIAQLTKSLSNEWAGRGVQVNAIAPGYMATEMNTDLLHDDVRLPQVNARIPAGRWGNPDDLAGVSIFLSSAASDYISGVIVPVDGGYLAR